MQVVHIKLLSADSHFLHVHRCVESFQHSTLFPSIHHFRGFQDVQSSLKLGLNDLNSRQTSAAIMLKLVGLSRVSVRIGFNSGRGRWTEVVISGYQELEYFIWRHAAAEKAGVKEEQQQPGRRPDETGRVLLLGGHQGSVLTLTLTKAKCRCRISLVTFYCRDPTLSICQLDANQP